MNILLLANELRYTCGVTNHLLHLSRGLMQSGKLKLWILCGGGNGINRFSDIDVNIISDERFLHINRSFSGFISALNYLTRFVRKNEIDVLHSHYHYGAAIARRASQLTRRTTIQTNHGILADNGKLKHFNADKYIAINEHIGRYIKENKIAGDDDIEFIRCGVPIGDNPAVKDSKGTIKIVTASRLTYGKGLDVFINAVNKQPESTLAKAEFCIAGEGELDDELRELNSSLGSKIKFVGKVNDIYAFLNNSHVLVNPSRSPSEGFPAIISEAGATNTLVVSSDFAGAEDVIIHGVNGLVYKDNNPDMLSDFFQEVISNYEKYAPLSQNLYEFTKKEFSIPIMIEKHITLYNKCLR
jgi:glycosyltransferase involved in cell wall biosynthesis